MKIIDAFEKIDKTRGFEEQNINSTVYWAYKYARNLSNPLLDFSDVIWDYDIDPILDACKAYGITEFTISCTFSSLIATLAEFEKRGCHMVGLTQVTSMNTDWRTGEHQIIPAIKMNLA